MGTRPVLAALALAALVALGSETRSEPRPAGALAHATMRHDASRRPEFTRPRRARSARYARPAVPILMYHVLADPPPDAPYPDLYVRPAEFVAQMDRLERAGFSGVTLRDVWDHWHGRKRLPARPIVISFDDGYRSVAEVARPALEARGWPAVLNLTVKNLDVSGGLGERQLGRLVAAGWEVASHTLTHPDLTRLGDRDLARELAGSRRKLERRLGVRVEFFCYPSGRYDDRVVDAVRRAGYRGSTTTRAGLAVRSEPFELRRVRVGLGDDPEALVARLGRS